MCTIFHFFKVIFPELWTTCACHQIDRLFPQEIRLTHGILLTGFEWNSLICCLIIFPEVDERFDHSPPGGFALESLPKLCPHYSQGITGYESLAARKILLHPDLSVLSIVPWFNLSLFYQLAKFKERCFHWLSISG